MSLILNIDTATPLASVCLAQDGSSLEFVSNTEQPDHASWLHPAIAGCLERSGIAITTLQAVAVSIGPGSYTGLRVGLSAAKGICYAQQIPLITIGTLDMMAHAAMDSATTDLICPLIDARRMEVFTAVYNKQLGKIFPPQAMVIDEKSFKDLLANYKILFFGDGSSKLKSVLSHTNALFGIIQANAAHLAVLSHKKYLEKEFADLAYAEPQYLKEFYFPSSRSSA